MAIRGDVVIRGVSLISDTGQSSTHIGKTWNESYGKVMENWHTNKAEYLLSSTHFVLTLYTLDG